MWKYKRQRKWIEEQWFFVNHILKSYWVTSRSSRANRREKKSNGAAAAPWRVLSETRMSGSCGCSWSAFFLFVTSLFFVFAVYSILGYLNFKGCDWFTVIVCACTNNPPLVGKVKSKRSAPTSAARRNTTTAYMALNWVILNGFMSGIMSGSWCI